MINKCCYYLTLAIFLCTQYSCSKKDENVKEHEKVKIYTQEKEVKNVSYGENNLQKMDVYFPEGYDVNTPVVFYIHGGGFIAGTKDDVCTQAKLFMSKGFVVINISHRLIDTTGLLQFPPQHKKSAVTIPDQLKDIDGAVNKYKQMAKEWGSGTSKMFMAGHSAGGTLAMLYVQGNLNVDNDLVGSGNIAGIANITIPESGYDIPTNDTIGRLVLELMYRCTGQIPSKETALYYMAISPDWVTATQPGRPNISVMPENNDENLDYLTKYLAKKSIPAAIDYDAQLKKRNIKSEYYFMPEMGHGFGSRPDGWNEAITVTANFFREI